MYIRCCIVSLGSIIVFLSNPPEHLQALHEAVNLEGESVRLQSLTPKKETLKLGLKLLKSNGFESVFLQPSSLAETHQDSADSRSARRNQKQAKSRFLVRFLKKI